MTSHPSFNHPSALPTTWILLALRPGCLGVLAELFLRLSATIGECARCKVDLGLLESRID